MPRELSEAAHWRRLARAFYTAAPARGICLAVEFAGPPRGSAPAYDMFYRLYAHLRETRNYRRARYVVRPCALGAPDPVRGDLCTLLALEAEDEARALKRERATRGLDSGMSSGATSRE